MQNNPIIRGTVVPGKRLGRTLGFPTANLRVDPGVDCHAFAGVWLARVCGPEGAKYWALVNVGTNPTVAEKQPGYRVEAWLMDFSGDLYDRELTVELLQYLRPEKRFPSKEALRLAMEADKNKAQEIIQRHEFTL